MVCASCGRAAKAGARFCGSCGSALAPRCAACGAECEPGLRFCEACGAPLAARPAGDGGARKVVTIVFADLAGSTALHERLDAEAVRAFMESYYAAMRTAVEAHGGRVTQLMGDGVKAVFGVPRVAEDDAIRAVRAGVEMQRAFRALADEHRERIGETGLRVAVNTGEVVSDGDAEIIGDPVNVAARLQEQGTDGDVVIGGSTQRIVASLVTLDRLGSFALKGRSGAVEAWRVVSLEAPPAAATPFVGRDDELRRLAAAYDAAVAAPAARLAVLLGSPGLGKSRLLAELARQLEGRARVLTAQCNPAGGATFAPLAEALRAQLGLESGAGGEALGAALDARLPGDDAERARIASGIGALLVGAPASPEETFFVVRRLLAALAEERPLVLAIDDVQWAEPLLLDFTEHLVQWGAGIPLLVVVAARPELRDARSSLTTAGRLVSDVVTLGGLDAGAAMRLAANVVGADTLPAAVAGRVLTTSEGNPLFLRELVRMLVNDGALRREGGRWTLAVDLAALEMPPTIQALLAARIERLRPEERLVLERAAVVGRRFSRAAVTHLLPLEAQSDLDARLEALRRSELIEADAGWLLGEPALRFHHVLIRDAAYRGVLRGTRAELHARFADWLEARAGESVEHGETIGWHLEQAHQHLRELGPLDADGRALGERAGRHLGAAGQRALARDDLEPAADLLGRALDCLDDADPARADLALDWCEALLSAGDVATASRALAELGRFTAGSERLRAWHTCFAGQLAALADPKALRASAGAVAEAAEVLAAAGDVAGEAKAHAVHADALARLGEMGACEAALDRALAAARRAPRDRRRANAVLAGAPLAALWGPSPVTRASGRCLDVVRVLRITQGAPAVEAVALRCQAVLETLRGRSEAARRMIASSRRLVEELGITQRLLEVDASAGLIELFEGDADAAERWLRPAYEGFRSHGLGVDAARTAALLGRALLGQGRSAEAEALSHESEALAGDDFKAAIAWRGVRAEALAGRGEPAAALELARTAVEIAAATDDLLDHADARSALAVALRAAGRGAEADAEEARATLLWEQKGATLLAERAPRAAARAAAVERAAEARIEPPRPGLRRVRPNAATAHAAQLEAVVAARDAEGLDSLLSDQAEAIEHPTGAVYDRRGLLFSYRSGFGARDFSYRLEPLATLGESLALCRESLSAGGYLARTVDVGTYDRERIDLVEVDAQGRRTRAEHFAADRLGDAVVRLYERHAERLSEGPERARAAATARSVGLLDQIADPERWATALAPNVEFVDSRGLALLPPASGSESLLRMLRSLHEVASDPTLRVDDVLALEADAHLCRYTNSGTNRAGGGRFERELLVLRAFGSDGLVARYEFFDPDRVAEALARFEELVAEPALPRIENAATRAARRAFEAWRTRDWERLEALSPAGFRHIDQRPLVRLELDRDESLASNRPLFEMTTGFSAEVLATRGERLALLRVVWEGADLSTGPSEIESLAVLEVDGEGNPLALVEFDPGDLDAAWAELDERYGARTIWLRRIDARDWDGLAALLAPDLVVEDHRRLGWETLHGPAVYVASFQALVDLAPDARVRFDHLEESGRGALGIAMLSGAREGGLFEDTRVVVGELDSTERLRRVDFYDLEKLAEARARYEALAASAPRDPLRIPPNAASRASERISELHGTRDWEGLRALAAPDFAFEDRQKRALVSGGVELWIRNLEFVTHPGKATRELIGTAGDRVALQHVSFEGDSGGGAFAAEVLVLTEVAADGRLRARISFDADDRAAAFAEAQDRCPP